MEEFISPFSEDQDTAEMREKLKAIEEQQRFDLSNLKIKIVDMVCGGGKTTTES